MKIQPWNKFDDEIGSTCTQYNGKGMNKNFLGSTRMVEYLMPKSGLINANIAQETMHLKEYNECCFALYKVTRTPDVPFGSKFSIHTLVIITKNNTYDDDESCRMEASSEVVFDGKPPMIAWKIRKGVQLGTTEFFSKMSSALCQHHNVSL